MAKHIDKKKLKKKKNKAFRRESALPAIVAHPNVRPKQELLLPKTIVRCDRKISRRNIRRIERYLRFAEPQDLLHLSCIRIVNPSACKMPSKQTTTGLYWPKNAQREAEILLSSELFSFPGLKWLFFNFFIFPNNRLFETLFHELGHHKAHHTRYITGYKQEAFAEKYMEAYKKAWNDGRKWGEVLRKIVLSPIDLLFNRYMAPLWFFPMRNKNEGTKRLYRLQVRYALHQITQDEYFEESRKMMNISPHRREKSKWTHPLSKKKYRDKFHLDE